MNKIYKNYVWQERDLQMPIIIRGRYMCLKENERSPKTIKIKLPFWILDYSFDFSIDYKVKAPLGKYQKREAYTLHLYPANCTFFETNRSTQKQHSTYILFKHGELAGLDKLIDPNYNYLSIPDPKHQISKYLVEIAEIGYKYHEQGFWQAQTLLFKIISLLHTCKIKGETAYIPAMLEERELTLIEKIDRYLFEHLGNAVSREEIAAKFNISVSSLSHIYKEQTGISPMKKLMQFRLNLAENMLQQGERLETIADAAGFSSAFHLSSMFKKNLGISPKDYRKKFGNEKII
jgi:AraC-like DNA-binding protein